MNKIPTVFVRNEVDRRFVTPVITAGCEWVFNDPAAVPTRKYDGTCCMLDEEGKWWARREVKPGKEEPVGFIRVQGDETTGKTVGWEPMEQSGFARWHVEALGNWSSARPIPQGTYELLGPKINSNREGYGTHCLVPHAEATRLDLPTPPIYEDLTAYMHTTPYEGIVWHHPDGRMAKLKKRDLPPVVG